MKKSTAPKRKPVKGKGAHLSTLDHIAEDLRPLAVPIGELKLDPENARTHDEGNIAAIAASLKQYGQLKPIVAQRDTGEILAGNGTLLAARKLGWSQLAVVWGELDPAALRGFQVADNRTAELAGWDTELLLAQIDLIEQETPDLAAALDLMELVGDPGTERKVELRPLSLKPPPAMTWVLMGLPTIRFGEIAETVERLAGVDGITLETTANDGPKDRQR